MKKKDLVVLQIITKLELGGAQKVCLSLADGLETEGIPTYILSGSEGVLIDEAQKKHRLILLPSFIREFSFKGLVNELKNFFTIIKISFFIHSKIDYEKAHYLYKLLLNIARR